MTGRPLPSPLLGLLGLLTLLPPLALGGCKGEGKQAPTTASVREEPPALPTAAPAELPPTAAPAAESDAELHAKAEEMLKSHARKREILIGGCGEDCGDAKESFYNYMRALAKGDDGLSAVPYLETSLMVCEGNRRGDGWVEMWRDGRVDERRASIRAFSRDIGAWVVRVATPDELEKALATGVEVEPIDAEHTLVRFTHPPLSGDTSAAVWRYTFFKRGWEWLISEVDTRPE